MACLQYPCFVNAVVRELVVRTTALGLFAIALSGHPLAATADTPPQTPMSQSVWYDGVNEWLETNLFQPGAAPFSFDYDGKSSQQFLADWDFTVAKKQLNENETRHVLRYVDPKTGLEVRCEAKVFRNHPAVEWIVKFRNTLDIATPIISDIQALDSTWTNPGNSYILHHALGLEEGISAQKEDFGPQTRHLLPNSALELSPRYGRPSWGESLPFFNIQMPDDKSQRGVIACIGWTGQWHAKFTRDAKSLNLRAGMEQTHLKLYPGEEIRSPKIMLLFWQGHRIYGQNLLRRIVLEHYYPQRDGKPLTMPFLCSSAAVYHEAFDATEQNQIEFAQQFAKLGVEYLWVDIGWQIPESYIGPIDRERFPNGFRSLSDSLKKLDMGLLVWTAVEYQGRQSWMQQQRGELFLKLKDTTIDQNNPRLQILNFADKDARAFLTDYISTLVQKEGIAIYRQDGPIGANLKYAQKQPLHWWRDNDAPDRKGITEIRYVEGLYAFWDEIVRRNPGLIIDMCGGGATRIDLEAMSRCVYLWRSDHNHPGFEPTGYQSHTYELSQWVPSTGTASGYPDTYSFRSSINNGVAIAWNPYQPQKAQRWPLAFPVKQKKPYQLKTAPRKTVDGKERVGYLVSEPFPWDAAQRLCDEFQRIRHLFHGDFYPLTPYSLDDDTWLAFQFHKEDLRQGMVLAFRRPECENQTVNLKFWGLSSDASYEVHFEDGDVKRTLTGKELSTGLDVTTPNQPGSLLITYRECP